MYSSNRIIRKTDVVAAGESTEEATEKAFYPLRIPGRFVGGMEDLRRAPEEPTYRFKGVLSGEWATLTETPIEVADLDVELESPVFRLDDSQSEEPERKNTTPTDPDELRSLWEAEWERKALIDQEQARSEGFRLGYEAAREEYQRQLERTKADIARDLERLEAQVQDFIAQTQPLLVELAFEIARALLDAPLPDEIRDKVTRALTEAVEQLAGAPLEIRLHPIDYLRLKENGIVGQLEAMNEHIRWESDPSLKEGDWIVQSPAAMIRRLQDELLGSLRSRIGPLSAVQNTPKPADDAE